jgi:hypothetical protein
VSGFSITDRMLKMFEAREPSERPSPEISKASTFRLATRSGAAGS